MPVTGQQAVGQALLQCAELSAGGYVLVRTGQKWNTHQDRMVLEYRVNVRLPRGQGEATTSSGQTLLIALQRAVVRLQAEQKRLAHRETYRG